jgi:N-acetylmuramoyl-L-alanine amidase
MIYLDPGHGGKDSGASSGGLKESEIVLKVARLIPTVSFSHFRLIGEKKNTADTIQDLRSLGVGEDDLVISIHTNATIDESVQGVEAWYSDNSVIPLAENICSKISNATGFKNRGIKHESKNRHGRLGILHTGAPAVLIELGFITNPQERKMMNEYPHIYALAIAQALLFGDAEKKRIERAAKAIFSIAQKMRSCSSVENEAIKILNSSHNIAEMMREKSI